MHKFRRKQHVAEAMIALALLLFLFAVSVLRVARQESPAPVFGATFSSKYAGELGLDWRRTYTAVLDELQVKRLRLPVYWSETAPTPETYNWNDVDWMVQEAGKRGVQLTLAIGRKLPRWPECYIPDWLEDRPALQQNDELLAYLRELVLRYDVSDVVGRWQVENEALFPFGDCPLPDPELFDSELNLVRTLSDKPIMLTASGEQEWWVNVAIPADILGVSLYRTTWNNLTGYFIYPIGPEYYQVKLATVRPLVSTVVLSELQAEPWFQTAQTETPLRQQAKMFTVENLNEQVDLAKRIGFDEIDLWGVEWWYWMKVQGEEDLWNAGKELYAE